VSDERRPPNDKPPPDDQFETWSAGRESEPDDRSTPRKRLGDFELLRELGRGGMGIVYEARQISLKRRVALKLLPPGLGLTGTAVQRFKREAQAAAKLHHTNIVPVYAIGEEEGSHYYSMELIEGEPLSRILNDLRGQGSNPLMEAAVTQTATAVGEMERPEPTPTISGPTSLSDTSSSSREWFDTVARLLADVADALHYAHGRGVIHRDVKPANLMLSNDGRLCLTDFGLARIAQEPGMTVSGSFLGTPAYMSPEQVVAGRMKIDHRTDVYSLGAVLYEMLTLRRAFEGETREHIVSGIVTKDPRPPRRYNPRVPVDLETICQKAMEKDPDRRYGTAGEFAEDLRQYLQHGLIKARRANIAQRTMKSIRRHPTVAISVLAVILLTAAGTVTWQALSGRKASDIERLVSDARLHLVQGEIGKALKETNAILAEAPANIDGLLIRARVHMLRWQRWDAIRDARAVLRQDPENWEAHLLVAVNASGSFVHSIPVDEHLAVIEGRVPDTADAYFLRGVLAISELDESWGTKREGIAWLDKALEMDPGHILALQERSSAYRDMKDLPRAMADAERLIVALPRSALGYIEKSWTYGALHDEEGKLEAANKAIELDPTTGDGQYNRAQVYRSRGRTDAQIADITRAIELNPTEARYSVRARAYQDKNEFDLAIADADRCIEINPDYAQCYQKKFWSYWHSGRKEEAVSFLHEFDEIAEKWVSKFGKVYRHVMWMEYYRESGDIERSIEEASRIIELVPQKVFGYAYRMYNRRMLEGEAGIKEDCDLLEALEPDLPSNMLYRANELNNSCHRIDQALEGYQAAIAAAPNWADPYRARAYLYWREKRYEEALDGYDRAIELAPNWGYSRFNRGQLLLELERFDEALSEFEQVLELGVEGQNLRWDQARALQRLGREQEALGVLAGYLEEHPSDLSTLQRQAILLFNLGRLDEAIASLNQAIEAHPRNGWLYVYRSAYLMFKPGMCERALEDLKKAEEFVPFKNAGMWSRVSQVHTQFAYHYCAGHYDLPRALELARKAAEYNTQNSLFKMNLGLALYRNGSYEEARAALMASIDLVYKADALHLFFVAMASQKLDRRSEAASYYNQAVARMKETWPSSPELKLIKNEAAQLLGVEP
jgi:serine/threonine protein kinase/Flp pilus assembly protein TadD